MESAVIFQIQSFLILMLFYTGYYYRILERRHVKFMLTAIIWDIALVLQIELTRGAINKASKAMENPMLMNIHVAMAVTTVLLYFFMIWSGLKLKNKKEEVRKIHGLCGRLTLLLRTLVFITSFFVATHN